MSEKDIAIDPNWFLPRDVDGMHYVSEDKKEYEETYTLLDENGEVIPVYYDTPGEYPISIVVLPRLYPPDSIAVVTQKVRVISDGSSLVDVLIDIDSVVSSADFDIRITKT